MTEIADNIRRVRERIAAAADRAGRDAGSVTLVAVTKTVEPERVRQAVDAGAADLGENYVQEWRAKTPLFGPAVRWHFIGHLQSNKARYLAGRVALVQSVDSVGLARELGRRAEIAGAVQPVLIEVKLDPDPARTGIAPENTLALAGAVAETPGLRLDGLMGMAPFGDHAETARPHFARLRGLFEQLPPANRRVLSMGMTGDFEVAVEEGTTLVRIGTAIFGRRLADGG